MKQISALLRVFITLSRRYDFFLQPLYTFPPKIHFISIIFCALYICLDIFKRSIIFFLFFADSNFRDFFFSIVGGKVNFRLQIMEEGSSYISLGDYSRSKLRRDLHQLDFFFPLDEEYYVTYFH